MSGLIYHTDKRKILPLLERPESFRPTENLIPPRLKVRQDDEMRPILNLQVDDILQKIEKWRKTGSVRLASEILSQAIVESRESEKKLVSEFLIDKVKDSSLLNWLLKVEQKKQDLSLNERLNKNFRRLKIEPHDALTWTDQAINFMLLNNRAESIEAIEKALKINSNLGYIVRNAARIIGLTGDNGRSIKILKKSEYYNYDPQILSAEIAFSQLEGRRTNGIEIGNKIIAEARYKENEKSELASALGTYEHFKGEHKRAKYLFELSLKSPNKNSLAQYLWYKDGQVEEDKLKQYEEANEIQAQVNFKKSKFEDALAYSLRWKVEEPYSIRPYLAASHLAGDLLEDFNLAYDIMNEALNCQHQIKGDNYSRKDEIILNNDMAYTLLKLNRIKEAEKFLQVLQDLSKISSKMQDYESVGIATLGLYAYKIGKVDLGRTLYRKAINSFLDDKDFYFAGSAFLNYFEEELSAINDISDLNKLVQELNVRVPDNMENDLVHKKRRVLKHFNAKLNQLS